MTTPPTNSPRSGAAPAAAARSSRTAVETAPASELEWLDRPELAAAARRRAIADLRLVNGLLLGRRGAVATALSELRGASGPQLLLDVAAGSGDVGAAIDRAAARRGVRARTIALDRELVHLTLGRQWGDVDLAVVARAEAIPLRDGAVGLALSSLFFHHLDEQGKVRVAAEMLRVARGAVVIVDLLPHRWARCALRVFFPFLGIGRIAREDGLTSLDRAWPSARWRQFLSGEGSVLARGRTFRLERWFPARIAIVLRAARGGDDALVSR